MARQQLGVSNQPRWLSADNSVFDVGSVSRAGGANTSRNGSGACGLPVLPAVRVSRCGIGDQCRHQHVRSGDMHGHGGNICCLTVCRL